MKVINSVENTKLPCYTLPLMQQHSFFKDIPFNHMLTLLLDFCFNSAKDANHVFLNVLEKKVEG